MKTAYTKPRPRQRLQRTSPSRLPPTPKRAHVQKQPAYHTAQLAATLPSQRYDEPTCRASRAKPCWRQHAPKRGRNLDSGCGLRRHRPRSAEGAEWHATVGGPVRFPCRRCAHPQTTHDPRSLRRATKPNQAGAAAAALHPKAPLAPPQGGQNEDSEQGNALETSGRLPVTWCGRCAPRHGQFGASHSKQEQMSDPTMRMATLGEAPTSGNAERLEPMYAHTHTHTLTMSTGQNSASAHRHMHATALRTTDAQHNAHTHNLDEAKPRPCVRSHFGRDRRCPRAKGRTYGAPILPRHNHFGESPAALWYARHTV